jgi:hypothetical protein
MTSPQGRRPRPAATREDAFAKLQRRLDAPGELLAALAQADFEDWSEPAAASCRRPSRGRTA